MRIKYFSLLIFLLFVSRTFSQTTDTCVTPEEIKLYDLIMKYRADHKLPAVPLSRSLSYVAHQHAWDLEINKPTTEKCNLHSWSKKGPWSDCCYTDDHKRAQCMWDKPRELTTYPGDGFEISSWSSNGITAAQALQIWQNSEHHNDVILNQDIWSDNTWDAIGISVNGHYAVVWFGEDADAAGKPVLCK